MQGRDIAGIFTIIWRINCYFLTIVHWISSASCHMIVAHLGAVGKVYFSLGEMTSSTYERLRGTCERLSMLMHHTRHMIVGHFGTLNCNGAGVDISPSCNENVIGISWEIATFWGCCSGGSISREEMARWPGGRAPSTVSFPNTSAWHCFSMWNPEYRRIE